MVSAEPRFNIIGKADSAMLLKLNSSDTDSKFETDMLKSTSSRESEDIATLSTNSSDPSTLRTVSKLNTPVDSPGEAVTVTDRTVKSPDIARQVVKLLTSSVAVINVGEVQGGSPFDEPGFVSRH
jgi:hypothetical protein